MNSENKRESEIRRSFPQDIGLRPALGSALQHVDQRPGTRTERNALLRAFIVNFRLVVARFAARDGFAQKGRRRQHFITRKGAAPAGFLPAARNSVLAISANIISSPVSLDTNLTNI